MLEYVRKLLLAQAKLAAQFEPQAQQPEIREYVLTAQAREKEEMQDGARRKQQRMRREEEAQSAGAEAGVEEQLRELSRQTRRMESLGMQRTAQEGPMQTRRLEREMTALQERQSVNLMARTPESAEGGLMGSRRQTMAFAGVVSRPSQQSMQEISRFFERDARRYG